MAGDERRTADVCQECGATGQTDVFCDSCGAVLRARALGPDRAGAAGPSPDTAGFDAPSPYRNPPGQVANITSAGQAGDPLNPWGGGPAPYPDYPTVSAPPQDAQYHMGSNYAPAPPIGQPAAAAFEPAPSDIVTSGETWDAASEWSHVLAPNPEPGPRAAPGPAAPPAPPSAPSSITPTPSRGPYEFTSRRPEGLPPGAETESLPQSLDGRVVSRSDAPTTQSPAPGYERTAPGAPFGADPATQYLGASSSSLMPYEPPGAPSARSGPLSDMERRARELIVPVSDRAPVEHRIVPVAPGMPETARPTVRTPQLHEVTGGVPCPWCTTPNPIDRHFCRRCAMSLAARPGGPRRKVWWRRLLDWRRRPIPFAGQRPRLRHGIGRLVRWTIACALIVILAFEIDWHAGNAYMDVEDHFLKPVETPASTWSAPESSEQYPVKNVHDDYYDTWWASSTLGESVGVSLTAKFDQPVDMLDVIITPGAGTDPTTFYAESRPQIIDVTLKMANGKTTKTVLTFNDTPGPATFELRGNDVSDVVFTIESGFPGSGPVQTTYLAISEIEFYTRSAQKG